MKKIYLGFDVGGTNIEAGLVTARGRVLYYDSRPTENFRGKKAVAQNVVALIGGLLKKNKACAGICLGWPSRANMCLPGSAIKKILKKKFNLPVILDNDANLFALAEATVGQGRGFSTVVGLTMGTGIGCGLVIDKKIYYGRGGASEFGHVTINYRGPQCSCGSFGCFECYAGSRGLRRLAKINKIKERTGEEIYKLAISGNPKALQIWREFGFYLGVGLASLINAYDPEIIIIGGKIGQAWRFFRRAMQVEMKRRVLSNVCPVVVSKLHNAAIVGAGLLASRQVK